MRPRILPEWSQNRKIYYHVLTLHFMTFIDEVIAPLYLIVALKMTLLIWEKGKVWRSGSPKFNRRQFFLFIAFHSKNFVMKSDFSWSLKPLLTLLRRKTKISDLIQEKDDIYWCTLYLFDWLNLTIIVDILVILVFEFVERHDWVSI